MENNTTATAMDGALNATVDSVRMLVDTLHMLYMINTPIARPYVLSPKGEEYILSKKENTRTNENVL